MEVSKTQPLRILHVVLFMVVGGAEKLVYDMVRYPAFAANETSIQRELAWLKARVS